MEENKEVQEGVEAEVSAEQSEADESAGFAAAFGETVRDEESPTDQDEAEEAVATEDEGEPEQEAEAQAEAEADELKPTKAGLTDPQLTEMLAKIPALEGMTQTEIRKLHGKFGELNRALQELQQGNGAKRGGKVTAAKLKRISEEFGEDFAQNLADDLNEAFDGAEGSPVDVEQQVEARVSQVKEELYKDMQKNLLQIQHRDWGTVVATPEFKVWVQTLPRNDQELLNDTWDAVYLSDKLTEFKSWRDKKTQGSQQRRERLQRAITPQGRSERPQRVELTEEDGFNMAFQK